MIAGEARQETPDGRLSGWPRRALPAALCVLLAASGCSRGGAGDEQGGPQQEGLVVLGPENLARVRETAVRAGPAISGVLEPQRQAALRAETGGAVEAIPFERGQAVRRGELLVRLDSSSLEDQLRAARAAARSAAQVLRDTRIDAERAERLSRAGGLSRRDLEQARSALARQRSIAAEAAARVASAEQQLEQTRVVAPFDGVVSDRQARLGDVVQVGSALLTVVDPKSMRLEATVPVEHLSVVKLGTDVDFRVVGYEGRSFRGVIDRIYPAADPATSQIGIGVSIPNPGGTLVGGLYAEGRIAATVVTAPAVPLAALDFGTNPPTVVRVREGQAERVPVEVGLRDELAEIVELRSGAAPGDLLVTQSALQGLTTGTKVRIVDTRRDQRPPTARRPPPQP